MLHTDGRIAVPTLDYEHSRPAATRRPPAELWVLGMLPTIVLVSAVWHDETTGDPVPDLQTYKAYHYAAAAVVLMSLVWLAALFRASRRQSRWLTWLPAVLWVCVNWYWTYHFLVDIRSDVSSQYFRTLWP